MKRYALFVGLIFFSNYLYSETGQYIRFEGFYGYQNEGYVQVRESEIVGSKLDLVDDLGLKNVIGLGLTYAFHVGGTWIELGYNHFFLDGKATLSRTTTFNGATYAPGDVNINKSNYRRYHVLFKHEALGKYGTLSHFVLGWGAICETLKFYIDGKLDESSTRFEKFESFDRQTVPVPALYGDLSFAISKSLGYGVEGLLAWLPKTKTWYNEGGVIYFEQRNVDAKVKLNWNLEAWIFSTGYRYKSFIQKQKSGEDTNEFSLSSLGPFLDVGLFF